MKNAVDQFNRLSIDQIKAIGTIWRQILSVTNIVSGMHGGGSSIVKAPGDVPPARVYFFKLSSLAKGILFANFSPFSLGKGMLFGNFRRF